MDGFSFPGFGPIGADTLGLSDEQLQQLQMFSQGIAPSGQPVAVPAPGSLQNPAAQPTIPVRGIRNNNPGNVEYRARDPWEGQTGTDGRFATFETPEHGIRAMARSLNTYQERHGLNDLRGMITRYAPPRENNTGAYINNIARVTGLQPTERFSFRENPERGQAMLGAMIRQENGSMPYTPEQISRGWGMAFPAATPAAAPAAPTAPPSALSIPLPQPIAGPQPETLQQFTPPPAPDVGITPFDFSNFDYGAAPDFGGFQF